MQSWNYYQNTNNSFYSNSNLLQDNKVAKTRKSQSTQNLPKTNPQYKVSSNNPFTRHEKYQEFNNRNKQLSFPILNQNQSNSNNNNSELNSFPGLSPIISSSKNQLEDSKNNQNNNKQTKSAFTKDYLNYQGNSNKRNDLNKKPILKYSPIEGFIIKLDFLQNLPPDIERFRFQYSITDNQGIVYKSGKTKIYQTDGHSVNQINQRIPIQMIEADEEIILYFELEMKNDTKWTEICTFNKLFDFKQNLMNGLIKLPFYEMGTDPFEIIMNTPMKYDFNIFLYCRIFLPDDELLDNDHSNQLKQYKYPYIHTINQDNIMDNSRAYRNYQLQKEQELNQEFESGLLQKNTTPREKHIKKQMDLAKLDRHLEFINEIDNLVNEKKYEQNLNKYPIPPIIAPWDNKERPVEVEFMKGPEELQQNEKENQRKSVEHLDLSVEDPEVAIEQSKKKIIEEKKKLIPPIYFKVGNISIQQKKKENESSQVLQIVYDLTRGVEVKLEQLTDYNDQGNLMFELFSLCPNGDIKDYSEKPLSIQSEQPFIPNIAKKKVDIDKSYTLMINAEQIKAENKLILDNFFFIFQFYKQLGLEDKQIIGWYPFQLYTNNQFNQGKIKDNLLLPPIQNQLPLQLDIAQKSQIQFQFFIKDWAYNRIEEVAYQGKLIKGRPTPSQIDNSKFSVVKTVEQNEEGIRVNIHFITDYETLQGLVYQLQLIGPQGVMVDSNNQNISISNGIVYKPDIINKMVNIESSQKIIQKYKELLTKKDANILQTYLLITISQNNLQTNQLTEFAWFAHPLFKNDILNQGQFFEELLEPPIQNQPPFNLQTAKKLPQKIEFKVLDLNCTYSPSKTKVKIIVNENSSKQQLGSNNNQQEEIEKQRLLKQQQQLEKLKQQQLLQQQQFQQQQQQQQQQKPVQQQIQQPTQNQPTQNKTAQNQPQEIKPQQAPVKQQQNGLKVFINNIKQYNLQQDVTIQAQLKYNKGVVNDQNNKPCQFLDGDAFQPETQNKLVLLQEEYKFTIDIGKLKQSLSPQDYNYYYICFVFSILQDDDSEQQIGWYSHPLFKDQYIDVGKQQKSIWNLPVQQTIPYNQNQIKNSNMTFEFEIQDYQLPGSGSKQNSIITNLLGFKLKSKSILNYDQSDGIYINYSVKQLQEPFFIEGKQLYTPIKNQTKVTTADEVSFQIDTNQLKASTPAASLDKYQIQIEFLSFVKNQKKPFGWLSHQLFKDNQINKGTFTTNIWNLPIQEKYPFNAGQLKNSKYQFEFEIVEFQFQK